MIPDKIPNPTIKVVVAMPVWFAPETPAPRGTACPDKHEIRRARVEVRSALYHWHHQKSLKD